MGERYESEEREEFRKAAAVENRVTLIALAIAVGLAISTFAAAARGQVGEMTALSSGYDPENPSRVVIPTTIDVETGEVRVGNRVNDFYYAAEKLRDWMSTYLSNPDPVKNSRTAGRALRLRIVCPALHRSGLIVDPTLLPAADQERIRARGYVVDLSTWFDRLAAKDVPIDGGAVVGDGGTAIIGFRNCDGLVCINLAGAERWTFEDVAIRTEPFTSVAAFVLLARDAAGNQASGHLFRGCQFGGGAALKAGETPTTLRHQGRAKYGVAVIGAEMARFECCSFGVAPEPTFTGVLIATDSWDEFPGVDTRVNGARHTQTGIVFDQCAFTKRSESELPPTASPIEIRGSVLNAQFRDCGFSVGLGGAGLLTVASETAYGRSGIPRGVVVSRGWFESGAAAVICAVSNRADRHALYDVSIDLATTGVYPWLDCRGIVGGQITLTGGRSLPK